MEMKFETLPNAIVTGHVTAEEDADAGDVTIDIEMVASRAIMQMPEFKIVNIMTHGNMMSIRVRAITVT